MNDTDHSLARLLRAAATSRRREGVEMPAGLAARVLAAWRTGEEDPGAPWFAVLCQRAVLCACAVACASLLLNLSTLENLTQLRAWHAAEARLIANAWPPQYP
jgi:hypothetical protein